MKLHFKEDPKEWRKVILLSLIGPSVLTGILCWRGVVSWTCLVVVMASAALVALCVSLRPRWFRGCYRFMTWLGFHTVQLFGKAVLTAIFFFIVTPLGWGLRLAGKDLLQLKPRAHGQTCWQPARQNGSLENMF